MAFVSRSNYQAAMGDSKTGTYEDPPPEYNSPAPAMSTASTLINQPIQFNTFRFPQDFGIYHSSGSRSDMHIALSAESMPLFYISTHTGWSSQPSVVLHSNPSPSSAALATAQFKSFSSTIDIMLGPEPHTLLKDGVFSGVEYFDVFTPSSEKVERFEWKSSSGPEVQALRGASHGMKLVRASNGEVVVAWTRPNSGTRKKGKMRFIGDRNVLGEKWEIMVVISLLAIVEKRRRANNASRAAGGGGGC